MQRIRLLVAASAFATLSGAYLTGCGDDPDAPPSAPLQRSFSGTVDDFGRVIQLDDLTLVIPPQAVSEPVVVTIDPIETPAFEGATGDWYEFGPAGLNFDVPAQLLIGGVDPTEDVVKWVEGPNADGVVVSALQTLPQVTLEDGRRQAELLGFSRVGKTTSIFRGSCRQHRAPPRITTATYDPCNDTLKLAWSSDGPVWIEQGFRRGHRAGESPNPVQWQSSGTLAPDDGSLAIRPGVYPGPDELAFTFVFRVFHVSSCRGTTLLSPPAAAEIPAPQLLRPPTPVDVQAVRSGSAVQVTWSLPIRPDGGIDNLSHDGFEIQRRPAWRDGDRRTGPDEMMLVDGDAGQVGSSYTYLVRTFRERNGCATPSFSALASTSVGAPLPFPTGPEVTRTCGIFRFAVVPDAQTIRVQNTRCTRDGSCPDARIGVLIDHIGGLALPEVPLWAVPPPIVADFGLVTIDSMYLTQPPSFGTPFATLSDGSASSYTATVNVRAPDSVFGANGVPLPAILDMRMAIGECTLSTRVTVTP